MEKDQPIEIVDASYLFPTPDRQIFIDVWVEANDIKQALLGIYDDAMVHYKTDNYLIESVNIVPVMRGGATAFDIYVTTRRKS